MLTRPKLMLPFQIARAMGLFSVESSPSNRFRPTSSEERRERKMHAARDRYGYDSFPSAPFRSAPSPGIPLLYRSRHQRGALAAAPPLLLAGRSRLRPAAVDRVRRVLPHQPHPQGDVQYPEAVSDRPVGEHGVGGADGHGARLPQRALPERRHVLPRLRVPPSAALDLDRRRADRAARGVVAA